MSSYLFTNIRKLKLKPLSSGNSSLEKVKVYDGVFYKVEKNKQYFYIGGSIHLGNHKKVKFNDLVENAYEESTKIAVELDITNLRNIINFYKCLFNTPTDKISLNNQNSKPDFLPPENRIQCENLCKQIGVNFEKYSKLPSEYFYSILQQNLIAKSGYKSRYGIDNFFIRRAKHDKKEVISLETPSTQIDALIAYSNLSPETLGNDKIVSVEASIESISKMHDAVFEGDTLSLVNDILIYKPANESDRNNLNTMLFQRNINMAAKIEGLIASQEVYFIIVGVAHVVGKGGLLKLFKDKGYKISRLK